MKAITTDIEGLLILEPDVYEDHRGYFFEPFNCARFQEITGLDVQFVQDNESCSAKNVVRGLHFQEPPHGQAKLLRATRGAVLDVAVDIRSGSPTYGHHVIVGLSAKNKRQFFIPEGFAHGFLALEDDSVVSYKCSGYYNRSAERSLRWNDPDLGIAWGVAAPLLSEKDASAPTFSEYDSPFSLV